MSKNQSIEDSKPTMVNEVSLFTDVTPAAGNSGQPIGLLLTLTYS